MLPLNKTDLNLPNLISFLRILAAPLLVYLAFTDQPDWYLGIFLLAEFSDVLDGYLARRWHQITKLGSHLDSISDFIIYSTVGICAWVLWPEIIKREIIYFLIIVSCFSLPTLIGFIKYRKFTGYHTWSVKLAVLVSVIGYILLFTELSVMIFRIATLLCIYAAIEEIAITLLIQNEHVDVRSVWQALKKSKSQE